ncbi:hypothetical protein E2C01_015392 [Portunus trituberculatus]|uniref:Uncharacterized protein n=1 Tax=Portunus trituberculatus TaxID=210409 RepID=A0A5B7DLR3_PORTR|nr:hypothetical protein [Portunus trituberculatus]
MVASLQLGGFGCAAQDKLEARNERSEARRGETMTESESEVCRGGRSASQRRRGKDEKRRQGGATVRANRKRRKVRGTGRKRVFRVEEGGDATIHPSASVTREPWRGVGPLQGSYGSPPSYHTPLHKYLRRLILI